MLKEMLSLSILFVLALSSLASAAAPNLESLQKMIPGVEIETAEETPVNGVYLVRIGGRYAYITADGNYALIGNLIDLKNGVNLTEKVQARDNVPLIKSFPVKNMIIFPASGDEKSFITIFSDTSCPYCRKLHKEIPALQQAGITVRYVPYPRGLKKGSGYQEMKSVWCSDDRVTAMNIANRVMQGELTKKDCAADNIIMTGYTLGNRLGVTGTPTIFLSDGRKLGGYAPANNIIKLTFPAVK